MKGVYSPVVTDPPTSRSVIQPNARSCLPSSSTTGGEMTTAQSRRARRRETWPTTETSMA